MSNNTEEGIASLFFFFAIFLVGVVALHFHWVIFALWVALWCFMFALALGNAAKEDDHDTR